MGIIFGKYISAGFLPEIAANGWDATWSAHNNSTRAVSQAGRQVWSEECLEGAQKHNGQTEEQQNSNTHSLICNENPTVSNETCETFKHRMVQFENNIHARPGHNTIHNRPLDTTMAMKMISITGMAITTPMATITITMVAMVWVMLGHARVQLGLHFVCARLFSDWAWNLLGYCWTWVMCWVCVRIALRPCWGSPWIVLAMGLD